MVMYLTYLFSLVRSCSCSVASHTTEFSHRAGLDVSPINIYYLKSVLFVVQDDEIIKKKFLNHSINLTLNSTFNF